MNSLLLYLRDGSLAEERGRQAVEGRLKEIEGPYWLTLTSPTEDDLAWLGQVWGFHPLTLEDCRIYNPRPKLEEYPGYLFLVVHEVSMGKERVSARDIQVYFSKDYLITVERTESDVLRKERDHRGDLSRGTDFALYRLLNHLTEDYFNLLNSIDERIEGVEEEVMTTAGRSVLNHIFLLRQDLIAMLRLAAPMRETLHQIADRDYSFVSSEHQLYFRDVHSRLVYVHEMIETQRDLTSGALEAYLSSISNNLNEVMKRLTLITTIFMPIGFVAAVGGMNFEFLPFHSPLAMGVTFALIMIVPLTMLVWFKTKGWV
ncbi:MAG: magnesium/cobalt transporter CorA [Dehalococcoidia bacterium]|nr:magnesium/cobalt transporter CorA [Dehalococcoidia bacterium]